MLTYSIFDDVLHLRNLVDTFFNEAPSRNLKREFPYVKLYHHEDELVLKAIVPGVASDSLNIHLIDNSLIIEGEKRDDTTDKPYIRKERNFGEFTKSVKLPFRVDADKINAELKNGILTVSLEKSEDAKPRKIEIH